MDWRKEHDRLRNGHQTQQYNFILTELELALTFCNVALSTDNREKVERNINHAQRAYDSARHFLDEAAFSGGMKRTLEGKIGSLRTLLRRLNGR
jgi:hypothetical protein